ncbi:MAG: serine/threonine protein kinase [Planctomycetes bacterium]|nr:serine/threonine protein kinase [Planctomycetota bacterium]
MGDSEDHPYPGATGLERLMLAFLEAHEIDDDEAFERYVAGLGEEATGLPGFRLEYRESMRLVQSIVRNDGGRSSAEDERELSDEEREALRARLTAMWEGGRLERRYELGAPLARGGTSVILAVRDREFGRDLAMKVLLAPGEEVPAFPALEEDDTRRGAWLTPVVQRFVQEARVTARLEHPGIVPVYDLGADGHGRPYFTMKRVHGRTLEEVALDARHGRGGWSINRVVSVLQRVCEAVSYAHSQGVLHGDLKPGNIMVGEFGETYVMDWGLCVPRIDDGPIQSVKPRVSMSDVFGRARSGSAFGTVPYMAPEQARGAADELDECADVYSIGAVLYHVLTGIVPYTDVVPSRLPQLVLLKVRGAGPSAIHDLHPEAPAALIEICERAMARDPGARHPTVAMLGNDLSNYLADLNDDRRRAQLVNLFLQRMLAEHSPDRARGRDLTVAEVVERAVQELDREGPGDPADEAELRFTIGRVFRRLDRREQALRQLGSAEHLFQLAEAGNSRSALACRYELSLLVERQGDPTRAVSMLEELASRQEGLLGEHDEDTLETLFLLAEARARSGDLARALELHEIVYGRRKSSLGAEHPSTLDSLGCLAIMKVDMGDVEGGIELQRRVLDGCVREWGEDHPQTIIAYSDLASIIMRSPEVERGLGPARIAAELSERVHGPAHLYTLTISSNLGQVLWMTGRLGEADIVLSRTVERMRAADITPGRVTFSILNNLAVLRTTEGRFDEALALHAEAVAGARRVLGDDHYFTGRYRSSYGRSLLRAGRVELACDELAAAYKLLLLQLGDGNSWTIEAFELLEEALGLLRRGRRGQGDDPGDVADGDEPPPRTESVSE